MPHLRRNKQSWQNVLKKKTTAHWLYWHKTALLTSTPSVRPLRLTSASRFYCISLRCSSIQWALRSLRFSSNRFLLCNVKCNSGAQMSIAMRNYTKLMFLHFTHCCLWGGDGVCKALAHFHNKTITNRHTAEGP